MRPEGADTTFDTLAGERFRLALGSEEMRPVAFLDGHIAEIDGTRVFRTVHVTDWKVPEGLHGMPAWVGVLESQGVQVGLQDRNTGAFYLLDADAAALLAPNVGDAVLLEGYVEGAHVVRVLYFRVLAPAP